MFGAGDSGALPRRRRCVGSRAPASKLVALFPLSYYITYGIIPYRIDYYIFQTFVWVTAVARRRVSRFDRSAMKVRVFG